MINEIGVGKQYSKILDACVVFLVDLSILLVLLLPEVLLLSIPVLLFILVVSGVIIDFLVVDVIRVDLALEEELFSVINEVLLLQLDLLLLY